LDGEILTESVFF